MPVAIENPHFKILHVLTLNGRNGEYGGPVRVARELCIELNARGHTTHIFSGAIAGSEPKFNPALSESFVHVIPITQRLKISSLWSLRLISPLRKLIKESDVIHIHFARDLIPFLAAFLSIISRKPFITQTHGMIISDERLSTRMTDLFLTRPLISKSKLNLVLTDFETAAIKKLRIVSPTSKLPNGIAVGRNSRSERNWEKRIVFCSRLDKRKGVDKFIALAYKFKKWGFKFEIYGPDGGQLELIQSEISAKNLTKILEYKGSLVTNQVQEMLQGVDLLILPSKNEPFPMIVLEAMAVGTQVLVMPSCGFANDLASFEPGFVAKTDDMQGLLESFQIFIDSSFNIKSPDAVRAFCDEHFGITSVVDRLLLYYIKVLTK